MKKASATLAVLSLMVFLMVGCGGESTQTDVAVADNGQMESAEYPTAEQKTTARHIMRLGQCIEQYIMDNEISPKTSDIAELEQILLTLEISEESEIYTDGWGNPLIYVPVMTEGSKSYSILSYGSDGAQGPEVQIPGLIGKADEDFIYSNGSWRQLFEGPMPIR